MLSPAEQQQVAQVLEDDARSDDQHPASTSCWPARPPAVQAEIIRINTEARPVALQVALLIPILAGLLGLVNAVRMRRLPDPAPSSTEGTVLG